MESVCKTRIEDTVEQEKDKKVREADDQGEGLNQPDGNDEKSKQIAAAQIKERTLYRQHSGTDVPWFPHDNDMDLLKELYWEAGCPRWVFFGTPAGGAGMHGVLEMGCSVVALCYDDHHRTHLQRFLVERAVEAMVQGTTLVFKDDSLQARAVDLKFMDKPKTESATDLGKDASSKPKAASAKGKEDDDDDDDDDSDDDDSKKIKKKASGAKRRKAKKSSAKAKTKATPEKKKKAKKSASGESSSGTSSSESDSAEKTPAKKTKRE